MHRGMKLRRARRSDPASASRCAMAGDELAELVEIIKACIAARGIYALMDDRLDLVCGPDAIANIDSPAVMKCMEEFGNTHGLSVTRFQTGFVLWPNNSATQS